MLLLGPKIYLFHLNLSKRTLPRVQVSVDHVGEHYASCSDEGRVVVTGLYSDDNGVNFNMDRAVQSIAFDLLARQLGAQVHDGGGGQARHA